MTSISGVEIIGDNPKLSFGELLTYHYSLFVRAFYRCHDGNGRKLYNQITGDAPGSSAGWLPGSPNFWPPAPIPGGP
jgi:hypothetical protein